MNPRSLRSNYTVGPKRSVGMAKWRVTATWARAQADGRSQPTRVPMPDLRHRKIRLGVARVNFRLVSSRPSRCSPAGRTGRMGATAT